MNPAIWVFLGTQAIALGSLTIGLFSQIKTKLRELEIRVQQVEHQDNSILEKLDKIKDQISNLRIDMQNKKNREQ